MSANAFALLALRDNENPDEALDKRISEQQAAKAAAAKKAKAPKAEDKKPEAKKAPAQRNNRRDNATNGDKTERRPRRNDGDRDARPQRSEGDRRRNTSESKGDRPPRREKDRKSGTGRGPQDNKRREESKLNLGKETESEAAAAIDAAEDGAEATEEAEPVEAKEATLTLAEYRATLSSTKVQPARKVQDEAKGTKFDRSADEKHVTKGKKKGSKKTTKEDKSVNLNLKFAPEERAPREDTRDFRKDNRKGAKGPRAPKSASAPDFKSEAAFPTLG